MKICEDCIKQDVCKFKEEVSNYEGEKLPEPLTPKVECKFKQTTPYYTIYNHPCATTATVTYDPSWVIGDDPPWDVGDYPLAPQISWC